MTMPYRVWDNDLITRTVKCDHPAGGWSCNVVGSWTEDHYEYGFIGYGKMGGTYQWYHVYIRPETDFDLPASADIIHAYRINYDAELIKNTTSHTSQSSIPKTAKNSNAWTKDGINGKYYDGINQWDNYPPISGGDAEHNTYNFASLPLSLSSWFYSWTVAGYISYASQDDLIRNGIRIYSGNPVGGSITNDEEYLIGIIPTEIKIQYLNAVVNSISKVRLNPIGGDTIILTGLGFYNSTADLDEHTSGGPPSWNRRIDKIYFEGREGQATVTLDRIAGDFTVDSDTQITITAMPALTEGTYSIKLRKESGSDNPKKEIDSYAGDYKTDSDGLMTAGDRFVLMVGTPGVNYPPRKDPIFLTKWRFKDADGNIIFRYYSPIDVCASDTFYDGRIIGVSGLQRALDDNTGLYLLPDMTVEMSNTDFEFSKLLAKYMVKNQIVELFHAWTDEPHAWRSHSFIGIVDDVDFKHPVTTFYLKDIFKKYFDKKVPLYRITNEEFPSAHEAALTQSMPEVLGLNYLNGTECKGAVQAHCIDTASFIYLAARIYSKPG